MIESEHGHEINGLARQCPKCGIVAHYEVSGRKPKRVECPLCDTEFEVQKYCRGERPKCKEPHDIL